MSGTRIVLGPPRLNFVPHVLLSGALTIAFCGYVLDVLSRWHDGAEGEGGEITALCFGAGFVLFTAWFFWNSVRRLVHGESIVDETGFRCPRGLFGWVDVPWASLKALRWQDSWLVHLVLDPDHPGSRGRKQWLLNTGGRRRDELIALACRMRPDIPVASYVDAPDDAA